MMNKILTTAGMIILIVLHLACQPSTYVKPSEEIQATMNEYKATCVKKTQVESVYYSCKDLKNYLDKRGYGE